MVSSWGLNHPVVERPEVAKILKKENNKITQLYGYVLRVDLSSESFDPTQYNDYNGTGLAQKIIDALKSADLKK